MPARERPPWLPPIWYLAAVSIVSTLSAWAGVELARHAGDIAPIWFTNGILLAVLLTHPTRHWPALLAAGLAGLGVAGQLAGGSPAAIVGLLSSGAIGIAVPAAMLRYRHGNSLDLTLPRPFIEFVLVGVVLTPALSVLVGALLLSPTLLSPTLLSPTLLSPTGHYLGDAVGVLVMTPLAVSVLGGELIPLLAPAALARTLGVVGTYVAVVVVVFGQSRIPLLFLPMPPLLLAVSWLGLPGAGLIILPTAAIAFGVTVAGHGPLLMVHDISSAERLAFLQIYIAIAAATAYSIGIIIAGRRRLNQALLDRNERLAGSERSYRLLADNASDIITRTRLDGQRVYVSPSCRDVLGWSVAEMLHADWQSRVHPEDVEIFRSVRDRMQAGALQAGATYRYRRKDGTWAWLEARAHMVLEPDGSATEFTGILRDVSRQIAAELALAAAMAELSHQASTDGLTGIANRRRFDEMLPREWRRAMRAGEPLSLLVVDVDHFKAFNELYGHLGGDECLRLIAQTMAVVIRRPHDLVARYGGEEFVAVLPATAQDGAERIAEALCAAVVAMALPHVTAAGGSVTISIGVATAIPNGDTEPGALIDAADNALYAAKDGGRNRVAVAGVPDWRACLAARWAEPPRRGLNEWPSRQRYPQHDINRGRCIVRIRWSSVMLAPNPRLWLPPLWHLAAIAIVSGLTAWIGIALTRQVDSLAAVWFTNGILLAVLLTRPVRQWAALLALGLVGIAVAGLANGQSLPGLLVLQMSNAIDILLPAGLLRYRRGNSPDLALPGAFVEFTLIAVLLTPALSGLLSALLLAPSWHLPVLTLLGRWYLGDALGIAVMTPLALSVLRGELRPLLAPAALARTLGVVGIYLLVITVAFSEGRFPLLFLPIPLLLLVVARLGFPGAGLIILPTAAIGFGVTVAGHGPLMLIPDISPAQRLEFLQIYLAIASATAYSIGVIIAGRRRVNQALLDQNTRLADSERLYRLLADNASDIITRVPLDGDQLYYSPAVSEVLGWSVAEVEQFGLRRHVHPDDDRLFRSVHEQMSAGLSETSVTFRCARKAGGWAWVEARVHLVRDPHGAPKEFIAILRDVTRQKETELALEAAMVKLSQQAITDGLTGIANRRRFDEVLPREWRRAMRVGDPLSLLLIDVDHFKGFNDRFGHQGGDECLRLIAQTIAGVIRRPHDLVARYGGEEFVAVLPATTLDGAQRIAEALREAVEAMPVPQILVPQMAAGGSAVTISIGVATVVPAGDMSPTSLIDAADGALYTAKRNGRNRVSVADRSDLVRVPAIRVSPLLDAVGD